MTNFLLKLYFLICILLTSILVLAENNNLRMAMIKENENYLELINFISLFRDTDIRLDLIRKFYDDQHSEFNIENLIDELLSEEVIIKKDTKISIINNKFFENILSNITKEQKIHILEETARFLNLYLPDKADFIIQTMSNDKNLTHVILSLLEQARELNVNNENLEKLEVKLIEFKIYAERKNDKNLKEKLLILKDKKNILVSTKAKRLLGVFSSWFDQDYNNDIEYSLDALKVAKTSTSGEMTEEIFLLLNRLTQAYLFKGDVEEAKIYSDQAKEIIEKQNEYLSEKEVYYRARSKIFLDDGKYNEALQLAYKAKDLAKPQHLNQVQIRIASILFKLEDYQESLRILNEMSKNIGKLEGTPAVAGFYLIYSRAQTKLGMLEEAKIGIDKVYEIYKDKYNKPSLFLANLNIVHGDWYYELGRYNDAFEKYTKSVEILKLLFEKEKKTDNLSEAYFKLVETAKKLNDENSFNFYFLKHQEIFGVDHFRTKKLINQFAKYVL